MLLLNFSKYRLPAYCRPINSLAYSKHLYSSGFLMLELGIAIVLLSFFFGLFSTWYVTSYHQETIASKKLHALWTARGFLEQCRQEMRLPENGLYRCDGVDLTIYTKTTPNNPRFRFINITADYQDSNAELQSGIFA